MKYYNTQFIKKYIEENKERIQSVDCGMREDWHLTAETVFENGEFIPEYEWDEKYISVWGIMRSTWATPVMKVYFKDGSTDIVPCYEDDGKMENAESISEQKSFAAATGGMDYLERDK